MDVIPTSKFRKIFVCEPTSHDYSPLRKYTDQVKFLASGVEQPEELPDVFLAELSQFDPHLDAIIPTGKLASNLILGAMLQPFKRVTVGVFFGGDVKDYIFKEVDFGY